MVICVDTHQRFWFRNVSSCVQLLSTGGYIEGSFDAVDEVTGKQWDAALFYVLPVVFKLRPRFIAEIFWDLWEVLYAGLNCRSVLHCLFCRTV